MILILSIMAGFLEENRRMVRGSLSDLIIAPILATREDVFPDYTIDGFRAAFGAAWETAAEAAVTGTPSVLLRLHRRASAPPSSPATDRR